MKRKLTVILIILVALSAAGCGQAKTAETSGTDQKTDWKLVSKEKTGINANISGFISKDTGIAVGEAGATYYSTNSGKSWQKGNVSTPCLYGLAVINSKTAYACGNVGNVIKTTNGGKKWDRVSDFGAREPNQPRYVSFVNENTGWIASPKQFTYQGKQTILGSTADGGKTWKIVNLPAGIDRIEAIYLRTANDGYVLDASGNLYITADGGKSFKKQALNLSGVRYYVQNSPIFAFVFTDEKNAVMAYCNDNKVQIIRSSDGGTTWTKESLPDLNADSLYFTRDGKYLTVTKTNAKVELLKH